MSTAVQDPPKVQTDIQPKIPAERSAAANEFLRPKIQETPPKAAPAPVIEQEKKPEEVIKLEEKKPEEQKPDPREQNLGELRKMRDEARKQHEEATKQLEAEKAERARIAAEYEEFKKQPVPKEFHEKLTKAEQEKEEIRLQLRAASLERDPQFRKEYNDRINANAATMRDQMVAAGVDPKEAAQMIGAWNEEQFATAMDSMTPVQKIKFQAAWTQAEQTENERRAALANADSEWKKRETAMQEQARLQQEQGQQYLKSEQDALFKELAAQEHLKDNQELLKAARESVDASYTMPPKEIMRHVATARLLAEGVKIKDAEIEKLKGELDELKKKHEANEAFIKNQNGGTARISPTDPAKKVVDKKERANAFLNPTFAAN